ncbi:P-loop containing nucleoside triphosphate hydrolase [Gracilaria domingensis]|nr:P-loop containing nucleoside triphosphate hydrolase [Gracilaria domingensis]
MKSSYPLRSGVLFVHTLLNENLNRFVMGEYTAYTRKVSDEHPTHTSASQFRHRRKRFSAHSVLKRYPNLCFCLSILGLLSSLWLTLRALWLMALWVSKSSTGKHTPVDVAPRPIFVIAGGGARTGSTFIFNILRVLMRIRDPNTVASSNWMLAKLVPEDSAASGYDRIALLKTMGTSILVKVHTAKQYYDFVGPAHNNTFAEEVDLLVTGYRDLREETVSAFKMFAKNRSEWESENKWAEQCQALIRRRNTLILEAGSSVPVLDIRYESWADGTLSSLMGLIRKLGSSLPWEYSEKDYRSTLDEVSRLRVPLGGEPDARVNWHVSNLMSPKHISTEQLSNEFLERGMRAVALEPKCATWLSEKGYM